MPLGRQTMIQIETKAAPQAENLPSTQLLKRDFQTTLRDMDDEDMQDAELHGYSLGDGCVIVAFWPTGNAVLMWNGNSRIDINLFTIDQDDVLHTDFEESFIYFSRRSMNVVSRDEIPRGIGRVVNFQSEIDRPHGFVFDEEHGFQLSEEYGYRDEDEEDEDMMDWSEDEDDDGDWDEEDEEGELGENEDARSYNDEL